VHSMVLASHIPKLPGASMNHLGGEAISKLNQKNPSLLGQFSLARTHVCMFGIDFCMI